MAVVEVEGRLSLPVKMPLSSLEDLPVVLKQVELESESLALSSHSVSKSLMVLAASFSGSVGFDSSNERMGLVVFW